MAGSPKTAYRRLNNLKSLGLINQTRGRFNIKSGVISQPINVLSRVVDSLIALKQARRFGKYYDKRDIKLAKENVDYKFITLDYKAWELTKFQYPSDLYLYVKDQNDAAMHLKKQGFSEGRKGHIIILPELGNFQNEIERVYLDCIANDGRSKLDAVAIEMLYGDRITIKGRFTIEDFRKVSEELRIRKHATSIVR